MACTSSKLNEGMAGTRTKGHTFPLMQGNRAHNTELGAQERESLQLWSASRATLCRQCRQRPWRTWLVSRLTKLKASAVVNPKAMLDFQECSRESKIIRSYL